VVESLFAKILFLCDSYFSCIVSVCVTYPYFYPQTKITETISKEIAGGDTVVVLSLRGLKS
jgi:hypothetical protein